MLRGSAPLQSVTPVDKGLGPPQLNVPRTYEMRALEPKASQDYLQKKDLISLMMTSEKQPPPGHLRKDASAEMQPNIGPRTSSGCFTFTKRSCFVRRHLERNTHFGTSPDDRDELYCSFLFGTPLGGNP